MVDMPLGVYRLDSMLDGGVPTGSVIVLATDPGAGGRKFARTSATMNALATTDNELYERYYRRDFDADSVVAPGTVNYVSLSATAESLEATLAETVAAREPGNPPPDRVLVSLRHVHLPKLDAADVLDYASDRSEVRYEGAPVIERLLERC